MPTKVSLDSDSISFDDTAKTATITWTAPSGDHAATYCEVVRGKFDADYMRAIQEPKNASFGLMYLAKVNAGVTYTTAALDDNYFYIFSTSACNSTGCARIDRGASVDLLGDVPPGTGTPDAPDSPSATPDTTTPPFGTISVRDLTSEELAAHSAYAETSIGKP